MFELLGPSSQNDSLNTHIRWMQKKVQASSGRSPIHVKLTLESRNLTPIQASRAEIAKKQKKNCQRFCRKDNEERKKIVVSITTVVWIVGPILKFRLNRPKWRASRSGGFVKVLAVAAVVLAACSCLAGWTESNGNCRLLVSDAAFLRLVFESFQSQGRVRWPASAWFGA